MAGSEQPRPLVIHTVPRAVEYTRLKLDDPSVTESQFRHWMAAKKVRFRKFGGTYTFRPDELDEDLAGRAA